MNEIPLGNNVNLYYKILDFCSNDLVKYLLLLVSVVVVFAIIACIVITAKRVFGGEKILVFVLVIITLIPVVFFLLFSIRTIKNINNFSYTSIQKEAN